MLANDFSELFCIIVYNVETVFKNEVQIKGWVLSLEKKNVELYVFIVIDIECCFIFRSRYTCKTSTRYRHVLKKHYVRNKFFI